MKDFAGKTAVVTGAASGIGLALAERFAAARMRVVLADIEEDALGRAVEQLEARQAEVIGVPVNTMVRESVFELAERAIDAFGKVHVLCNNAGVASTSSFNAAIWELSVPSGTGCSVSISTACCTACRPSCRICWSTAKAGTSSTPPRWPR